MVCRKGGDISANSASDDTYKIGCATPRFHCIFLTDPFQRQNEDLTGCQRGIVFGMGVGSCLNLLVHFVHRSAQACAMAFTGLAAAAPFPGLAGPAGDCRRAALHVSRATRWGVVVNSFDLCTWMISWYGSTRKEHDDRLRAVMQSARTVGLTFNTEKCAIGVTEISFLGDIISAQGIRPSPASVSSVLRIPPPTDKLAVQRMLGVVNYIAKVIPALAEKNKTAPGANKKGHRF